jgi:hypothetical protein
MDIFNPEYFVWDFIWRVQMINFAKLGIGLTGLTALTAISSSAAAQTNQYGYGSNGGVIGAIVNAVTGYGQYPQGNYGYEQMGQRNSVEMCARTAEQRLNNYGRYGGNNNRYAQDGYNSPYGQNGYNNRYGQNGHRNGATFRVVGITNVERRRNGGLRVHGIASSDGYRANGWNHQRDDEQRNGDGYDNRYGDADGYGNNGYRAAGMDYRFTCKTDSRGAVVSLDFDRGMRSQRG